jgi:threonine aldolase
LSLPPEVAEGLRSMGWRFYTFIGDNGARFMCSWDTRDEDVDELAKDLRELCETFAKG